jgi:hypothetical protein
MSHHISINKRGKDRRYENHGFEVMEVMQGSDGKYYLVTENGEVFNRFPIDHATGQAVPPCDTIEDFGEIVHDDD